ncbi:phosphatase PAP2 family protein [Dendrosporobacter sp. 1207_IL3150]|uniref:phosphatase PAP2 family protein n=1 Tax=Dendrosporobacter sp. 1207_IL3150 TaxID=3084054 RepID=UPI002FDAA439
MNDSNSFYGVIKINDIMEVGLDFIILVQQFRTPFLDDLFRIITLMGEEEFYLAALPIILWNLEYSVAIRLISCILLSHYFNTFIKDIVSQPRPFIYNAAVQLTPASGYSFPSNHAQNGLVFWGGLGYSLQKKSLFMAAGVIAFLIGVSRVYLGVHFPSDILAGWVFGILMLNLFFRGSLISELAPNFRDWRYEAVLALIVPLLLLAVSPVRDNWAITAAISGGWFGVLIRKYFIKNIPQKFESDWKNSALRVVFGLCSLALILYILKAALPNEESNIYNIFRFIRYWLATIWAMVGVPWVFSKIKYIDQGRNFDMRR